jgi:hypothetical protein
MITNGNRRQIAEATVCTLLNECKAHQKEGTLTWGAGDGRVQVGVYGYDEASNSYGFYVLHSCGEYHDTASWSTAMITMSDALRGADTGFPQKGRR